MTTEIILPEMGEGVIEGTLSRWLVNEGDQVQQFDALAEIETDKVTTEITAEVSGTVIKLMVGEGETIPVETVLAYIGQPDENIQNKNEKERHLVNNGQSTPLEESRIQPKSSAPSIPSAYSGRISPLVGRIASEHNIDLALVTGTGKDGRITKDDILAYIDEQELGSLPEPISPAVYNEPMELSESDATLGDVESRTPIATKPSNGELIPMTSMRRIIADHMVLSKQTSPHVTTVFEIDFSTVAAHRNQKKEEFSRDGAKLTFTVYMVAAVVQALKAHPIVNSIWTDDGILLKREINLGMAVAVSEGLTVPVIKSADGMNLLGLARKINDLTYRARGKKLKLADLQEGTFSITNHGTSGSLLATPIINQPQAGILGFGMIEKRVKVIDDALAIRPLAYASFTFDHRILDGATADAFVSSVKNIIENWS